MVKLLSIVKKGKEEVRGERHHCLLEKESQKALWKRQLLNQPSENRGASCRLIGQFYIPYYPG